MFKALEPVDDSERAFEFEKEGPYIEKGRKTE